MGAVAIQRPAEVLVTRWPMCGGGTAYAVHVPRRLCPVQDRHTILTLVDGAGGDEYVSLCDATMPAEHWAMPVGWERYEEYRAHKKAAKAAQLEIAREVCPELAEVSTWPLLWVPEWTLPRGRWTWRRGVWSGGIEG